MNNAQRDSVVGKIIMLIAGILISFKIVPEDLVNEALTHVLAIVGAVSALITIWIRYNAKSKKKAF